MLIWFFGVLASCALCSEISGWNYVINNKDEGPEGWEHHFPKCHGVRNSPIDIDHAVELPMVPWNFSVGWSRLNSYDIINDGASVLLKLKGDQLMLSGGGLGGLYKALQLHFHWGKSNDHGSEHTLHGHSFVMEMHVLHVKSVYRSTEEALASNDTAALAVLAYFFEIDDQENPALDPFIEAINEVLYLKEEVKDFPISSLRAITHDAHIGNFYRYNGSLTTPPCNEQVIWTVFENPLRINNNQMDRSIRTLQTGNFGTEHYRPTVAIGDRLVLKYVNGIRGIHCGPLHVSIISIITTVIVLFKL